MGNYNRDDNRSGGGGFNRGFGGGGNRFDRGGNSGRPTMHKAVCSECGDDCEIPFRPTGNKPVFCSNCFGKQQDNGGGNRRSSGFGGDRRERRERPSFGDRQMYDAVCKKCGNNCQVPFRPSPGKDVFCDNCFEKGGVGKGGDSKDSGELLKQIKTLNYKIDKLIEALTPGILADMKKPETEKKEKSKKDKVKKEKVKKEKKEKIEATPKETKKTVAQKKETKPTKTVAKKASAKKKK